jgi:hypothetical protein
LLVAADLRDLSRETVEPEIHSAVAGTNSSTLYNSLSDEQKLTADQVRSDPGNLAAVEGMSVARASLQI